MQHFFIEQKKNFKLIIFFFFFILCLYHIFFLFLDGSQREHVCLSGGRLECPPHILETTSERFLEYLSEYQLNIINKV